MRREMRAVRFEPAAGGVKFRRAVFVVRSERYLVALNKRSTAPCDIFRGLVWERPARHKQKKRNPGLEKNHVSGTSTNCDNIMSRS